jgi:hypothetical protein
MSVQIDVKSIQLTNKGAVAVCNLYANDRCVKIYMSEYDYKELIEDGFFIRDGKSVDSANVLNTTDVYERKEVAT